MVQGNRNGDAFCTSVPMMLVRWQSMYSTVSLLAARLERFWEAASSMKFVSSSLLSSLVAEAIVEVVELMIVDTAESVFGLVE